MSSSGDESKAAGFPRHEYDAIEEAVRESVRGRWFLEEFARRNRAADTLTLLEAIGRLQAAVGGGSPAAQPPAAEIAALADAIKQTRSHIAAVRNDMLPDGGAVADDPAIYTKIAEHATATAGEMMAETQRLNRLAGELKAANANNEHVLRLESDAHSLQTLAWSQDVLSQRIAKAMGLLSHVDDRIAAMCTLVRSHPVEARHLRFFAEDERLFEPSPAAAEAPKARAPQVEPAPVERKGATVIVHRVKPAAPETSAEQPPQPAAEASGAEPLPTRETDAGKKRIVIIRRPPGEPIEIPLAGEQPEQVA